MNATDNRSVCVFMRSRNIVLMWGEVLADCQMYGELRAGETRARFIESLNFVRRVDPRPEHIS